jgi:hypothetical protein
MYVNVKLLCKFITCIVHKLEGCVRLYSIFNSHMTLLNINLINHCWFTHIVVEALQYIGISSIDILRSDCINIGKITMLLAKGKYYK